MTDSYRPQSPALPTPVVGPQPTVWSSIGQRGDRWSTRYGGPDYTGPRGTVSAGSTLRQQQKDPNLLTSDEAAGIGKTSISVAPEVPSPVLASEEELKPPERIPGFAEGMLGGLAQFFTGVLPGFVREPLVRGAELAGEVLDIPLGVLDHVPVNQIFGLEDVQGAFKMMPMTEEKARVIRAMSGANPTEMDWYMSQYLRAHAGDYAAAKELPQVLANVIRPDANPVERLLMLLGVPAQMVSRTVAGAFGRVDELLSRDVSNDPALSALKQRYLAGEFGRPGTEEAQNRLLDEMVTAGYGWGDDPFISAVAEMATDPLIWASMGTGLAMGAVRTGPIAARAANVARLARSAEFAADSRVAAAVTKVDDLVKTMAMQSKNPFDLRDINATKTWSDLFEKELGRHPLFDRATDELRHPVEGERISQARAYRRYAAYKLRGPIEAAAGISRALNEPTRLFGIDNAGKVIQDKWMRRSTDGAFAAFDYGKVFDVFQKVGTDTSGLEEAMGYAIAHSQKSLMKNNLVKLVRTNIDSGRAKLADHTKMPYALSDPEKALERARIDGHALEAQEMQVAVETWKKQYVPQNLPDDPVQRQRSYDYQMDQFREQAAQKFSHAARVSIDTARSIFKGADQDLLAFADYAHWGRTIKDFMEVRDASKANLRRIAEDAAQEVLRHAESTPEWAQANELAKQANADLSIAARSTLVGPNELTLDMSQKLKADMAAATDDAERIRIIDEATNQYEYLYMNLHESARITSDADLIHRFNTLIDEGIENNRFVKTLSDASLPQEMVDLKERLRRRGADYEIGLAPDTDRRWAPIYDRERNLIGYHPWMDVGVDPTDINAPRRLDLIRERLASPIRGENIVRKAQQRFVQKAAKSYGLNRGASLTLWKAVKEAAREEEITMRGFTPERFRAIMRKTNISEHDKMMLGNRGLADLVMHAMEGEIRQVGLTTKLTGIGKTRSNRFANFMGYIAESVYPRLRFGLNPFFQLQEFIEPYFFNALRGVKFGMRWGEEAIQTHMLLDEFNMADRLADGFEAREFMMRGAVRARQAVGPNTTVAQVVGDMPFGPVQTPKRVNYLNTLRNQFGDMMYDAFEGIEQGAWSKIEAHYNQLDREARGAAHKPLSRGEVAERWFRHRGLFDPDNRWSAIHHYDGAVPDEYGRIRGINRSYLAKQFGFSDGAALRAAADDPLNTNITEWKFRNELVMEGSSPEYALRAWNTLMGPTVDEVMDAFEGAYADAGLGFHRPLAEALLNRQAISKGISLDEYIASKFANAPQWVDRNARLPLRAYTQLVDRLADEFNMPPIRDGAFFEGMMGRAKRLLPGGSLRHTAEQNHVNAAKRVAEGKVERSTRRIAKDINVEDFHLYADGPGRDDFISDTLRVLTEEEAMSVGAWYPEVAPVIASIANWMNDDTVRAFVDAYNESGLGRIAMGDAVREEVGARMLMAWAATQVQTSPRDGFQFTLSVLDRVRNTERIGAKGIGSYGPQKAQFAAMFSDFTGFLSKEGLPTDMQAVLNLEGLGAKLHDFIDSLLGNRERRSYMRGGKQEFVRGDGTVVEMQPGAMDIWMGRDFGFVDSPMVGLIADRIRAAAQRDGKALTADEAMVQAQLKTGFFYRNDKEDAAAYSARRQAFEAEHGVKMQEVWSGSPSPVEYETMLAHYNRLTDELNSMNDGDGWLGRGYNSEPWNVYDVQAIAWMRIQKQLGIDPGGPNNMFYQNSAQVSFEVVPGTHTPLDDAIGMYRASADAKDLITSDVIAALSPLIESETGVQIRKAVPGMGGWRGGPDDYTLSPSTYWEMLGSPEAIDDALDMLMYLTQQDMVFATQTTARGGGGKSATVSGKDNFWSIDFIPSDDHPLTLERLAKWIEEKKAIEWNGHMVTGRAEGNNAVRSVYSPSWDDAPEGYRVIPEGTDLAGFEQATSLPPDVARMLKDGSWAREAGMDMDVPVTTERLLVRARSRTSDFRKNKREAMKRIYRDKVDAGVAFREEMGKEILDGLRARGRGDLADALVDRHMATSLSVYDAALKRYDGNAWSVARGSLGLREAFRSATGNEPYLQRRGRVWNGATRWSRDVDAAQRIIGGKAALSGRRGGIIFRETRADITTVPHELFHIWSDDLDPSGVRSIHDAFFKSDSGRQYLARGGTRPTGRNANNHLIRDAEEWAAYEFERYMATGVAPNGTMNAAFNDYADWYNTHKMFVDPDPKLDGVFKQMTPEMHRGQRATYDVDEYRFMEAARIALLKAEEEAFRVHYYRRGRTLLERSINHPYLGLYPASYMWGKVLPELMRFLVKKPFGVDAPLAGLAMANHVYEAVQLELNTDDGAFADFVDQYPELVRFLLLLVPGTPWDIPVNAPAWTRRMAQSAYTGQKLDAFQTVSDTAMYAMGPIRTGSDFGPLLDEVLDLGNALTGGKLSEEEQQQKDENTRMMRSLGANIVPANPPTYLTPRE